MNDIREKFEEIWPAPHCVVWNEDQGCYCGEFTRMDIYFKAIEWDARLDTFTRCQESTALYASLIDDMISDMNLINDVSTDLHAIGIARESIGRAKQKLEQIK